MPAAGPNVLDAAHALRAAAGGAGALVIKTISTRPARVPKPCMARVGTDGMLNCELWSELPAEQYIAHEYARAKEAGLPVIASIGYTADDLADLGPRVAATGCVDAIEFSLHYTGSGHEPLVAAARALRQAVRLPILAKLSPGMADIAEVAAAIEPHVDGFIAINSVGPAWGVAADTGAPLLGSAHGIGWLSGRPIKPVALRCVREVAQRVRVPVIGVGGIFSGQDAIEFIMAGARAVQLCTAAILRGPGIYGKVAREMAEWMDAHGCRTLDDVRARAGTVPRDDAALDCAGRPPRIDHARCVRCGLCVTACCPGALSLALQNGEKTLLLDEQRCVRCGLCRSVCPHGAMG